MTQQNDHQLAAMWAHELLKNSNFCILDTETTGLGSTDEIVQIAILSNLGYPLFNSLVKPTCPIGARATDIHGIDDEDVENAPTFSQLLVPILQAVGNKDLVIYNAEYDLKLIRQSLRPYGIHLAFPTSDRRQCRVFLNGGSIHCAMLQYSAWCGEWNDYHGNYRWQKLPGGDHSALGDCKATLSVMRRMAASYQEGA
ncbi:3'-5' exonuclease [Leptolyngbya sp. FACHB-16]|nr:3'-5' exonuclease [Leptolyngbya sp. FACHB-8]MBD2153708.1 3'-5' exonuclease [Leptolyngbya sp. FACHB-16]